VRKDEFGVYVEEPIHNMLEDIDHVLEPWQIEILRARLQEILELAEFNCF